MLDNLVTPVVAIAIILAITFPIWFLVLLMRFVHQVRRIANTIEEWHVSSLVHHAGGEYVKPRAVSNSMFGR